MHAEIIYSDPKINVHQEVSIINIVTEEDGKLVSNAITQHPNVTLHNEETVFDLSKRRIRQLVRKIDPDAKVLDVK